MIQAKDSENIYLEFFQKTKQIDKHINDLQNFEFLQNFDNSNILVIIPEAYGWRGVLPSGHLGTLCRPKFK